jgi:hypothetical protein
MYSLTLNPDNSKLDPGGSFTIDSPLLMYVFDEELNSESDALRAAVITYRRGRDSKKFAIIEIFRGYMTKENQIPRFEPFGSEYPVNWSTWGAYEFSVLKKIQETEKVYFNVEGFQ